MLFQIKTVWKIDYICNYITMCDVINVNYYLIHFFEPTIDPFEWPFVGDIVDEKNSLGPSRIRSK